MSKAHQQKLEYTLLSLSLTSSFSSVQSAFELLQKLSAKCDALLIDPPAEEDALTPENGLNLGVTRAAIIKRGAALMGVETTIKPVSFEDSLSHFKSVTAQDVLMLLQPDHPLERQSPSFVQLNKEVFKNPSTVIYMTDSVHKLGSHILHVGEAFSKSGYSRAKSLSERSRLPLMQIDDPGSLGELQRFLLTKPPSERPALILIGSCCWDVPPLDFFKFAALTGVPVGII